METFWLLGHEKLPSINSIAMHIEEVFDAVLEPEFLQIIWKLRLKLILIVFRCRKQNKLMFCVNSFKEH